MLYFGLILAVSFVLASCVKKADQTEKTDTLEQFYVEVGSVEFWLERVAFTVVKWCDEVDSFVIGSDWISVQRADLKNAFIRKCGWYYEVEIGDFIYFVKENPLEKMKNFKLGDLSKNK